MSAKLPVLQALRLQPDIFERFSPEYISGEKAQVDDDVAVVFKQSIDLVLGGSATYFDIQVGFDVFDEKYVADGKSKKIAKTDFGVVKPPYEVMWCEFSTMNLYPGRLDNANRVGCCVLNLHPEKYGETIGDDERLGLVFFLLSDKEIVLIPITVGVQYDKNGHVVDIRNIDLDDKGIDSEAEQLMMYLGLPVLTALSLINCRNVTTAETGKIGLARSGREKRRGVPAKLIRYNTIILPGGGSQSDGRGGHRAAALHRVRGHFKTFTASRPLMGRHVGTYWWGWQVRGSAKNGVVVSDYQLARG